MPEQHVNEESNVSGSYNNRIYRDMKREKSDKDMENITERLDKLVMLLERKEERNNNYRQKNNNRVYDRSQIVCYTCNQRGHYASECRNGNGNSNGRNEQNNQRNDGQSNQRNNRNEQRSNRNNRSVNKISVIYEENESEYESLSEYDSEREIYELRSGKRYRDNGENSENTRSKKQREERYEEQGSQETKRKGNLSGLEKGRSKMRQKNVCNRCGIQGHFGTECPRISCTRCNQKGHEWNKCPEYPIVRGEKRKKKEIKFVDEAEKNNFEAVK